MKKVIFTSLCMVLGTGLAFAENSKRSKKNEKPKKKETTCTVSCSTTVTNPKTGASITYTMTAGNIFTSCGTAQQKCSSKMKMTLGMEPTNYEL